MDYKITFNVNNKIYLRNPEGTKLGRNIVKNAIDLISILGFEAFTFKKLAVEIGTTEATIYRYFENKHRLLLYILNWYWLYLAFLLEHKLQGITDNKKKLKITIQLLTHALPESSGYLDYNKKYLNQIVIDESSKVYLVKEVNEINREQLFKPYKDLCGKIADLISLYNSNYKYPRTLSSTLVETAHLQQFFANHLPNLTDHNDLADEDFVTHFLENLLFKAID
jgi:AcrR family transcriptional regulator